MRWSDLDFTPSSRTLRQFAVLWILAFGIGAGWQYFLRDRHLLGGTLATAALVVGVPGVFWPPAIRFVYAAALVIAFPIGFVVSRLLLAIVFYGVFTPLALLFRLIGRDELKIRRASPGPSYWHEKRAPKDLASYLRQF